MGGPRDDDEEGASGAETLDAAAPAGPVDLRRMRAVLIAPDGWASAALPAQGVLRIGRAPESDLRSNDPSISRNHAVLHVKAGAVLELEDLGSSNGTAVRGERLGAGERRVLAPGEVADVGGATLVVQRAAAGARPRRISSPEEMEARLEEECERARESGGRFAVLAVRAAKRASPGLLEAAAAAALRPFDAVAPAGPGALTALIADAGAEKAGEVQREMIAFASERGVSISVGLACYPADGRAPDALVARAVARAGGDEPAAPSPKGVAPLLPREGPMGELLRLVERVARSDINVLVLGETGTGKEVVATLLHERSPRSGAPLVKINCAALSESLLESELFGHEKGAFTGALQAKPGLLESAEGGTVFLDEVGELPATLQSKLLRVLEEREVLRVGSLRPRAIDVRFVAATNRDLEEEVSRGRFRGDLYYRLNGIALVLPPLRERPSEIAPLAKAFATRARAKAGERGAMRFDERALALLEAYAWPGNVRELRNVVERAVVLLDGEVIGVEHLPVERLRAEVIRPTSAPRRAPSEVDRILAALEQSGGNQTRAASLLGISRRTLISRLEAYSLPRPRKG